jgi:hypothetical protein
MPFDPLKDSPMLIKLRTHVEKLHALLAEPEPGIVHWCLFVGEEWKKIVELWKPEK